LFGLEIDKLTLEIVKYLPFARFRSKQTHYPSI
jgi:hypothetical protein